MHHDYPLRSEDPFLKKKKNNLYFPLVRNFITQLHQYQVDLSAFTICHLHEALKTSSIVGEFLVLTECQDIKSKGILTTV